MVLHFRWQIVKRTLQYQFVGPCDAKKSIAVVVGNHPDHRFFGLEPAELRRRPQHRARQHRQSGLATDQRHGVFGSATRTVASDLDLGADGRKHFLREWVQAGETDIGPVVRYLRNIKDHFTADSSFFISERTRRCYHPLGIQQVVSESDPKDTWYF